MSRQKSNCKKYFCLLEINLCSNFFHNISVMISKYGPKKKKEKTTTIKKTHQKQAKKKEEKNPR